MPKSTSTRTTSTSTVTTADDTPPTSPTRTITFAPVTNGEGIATPEGTRAMNAWRLLGNAFSSASQSPADPADWAPAADLLEQMTALNEGPLPGTAPGVRGQWMLNPLGGALTVDERQRKMLQRAWVWFLASAQTTQAIEVTWISRQLADTPPAA